MKKLFMSIPTVMKMVIMNTLTLKAKYPLVPIRICINILQMCTSTIICLIFTIVMPI